MLLVIAFIVCDEGAAITRRREGAHSRILFTEKWRRFPREYEVGMFSSSTSAVEMTLLLVHEFDGLVCVSGHVCR